MRACKTAKLRDFCIKLLIILILDVILSANAFDNNNNNSNTNNNNASITKAANEAESALTSTSTSAALGVLAVTTTLTTTTPPATPLQNQTLSNNNNNNNNNNRTTSTSTTSGRQSLARVRINKCCQLNEYLDRTQKCMASSTEENWVPVIFIIPKRRLYPLRGQSPSFMTFLPSVLPLLNDTTLSTTTTTTTNTTTTTSTTTRTCRSASELSYFSSSGASANSFVIWSNGSLYITERSVFVEPRNYCVDRDSALVCLPELAKAQIQLKKCCGRYGNYNATSKKCVFDVTAPATSGGKLRLSPRLNESSYQTVYGLPECARVGNASAYAVAGDWQEAQLNLTDGQLTLPHKSLSRGEYCLEHVLTELAEAATTTTPTTTTLPVKIIACSHHFALNMSAENYEHEHRAATNQRLRDVVLHTCIVISVIFLAATLVAGYMMPSVHHALHWRCQIYYVFCLLIAELLFAYTLLANTLPLGSLWCMLIASAMQFFFLAAFFWLNTMCFNIWWTFRDFRPSSLERNQESLRLRLYSAYAWGIPLLISAIAAFVDELPEAQLLHPGFGQNSCWFSNERLSIFAYFFGPIGLLLCANIVLFISTTHQLTCGLWKRDDAKSTTEKTALGKVCLKLVVVMGVTWIADVISWLVGGPHSVWFVTDLLNALQGVFIFIVVGCQPQVWAACKRICCPRLLRHDITNTTNGVQHSSSSQGLPSMGGCTGTGTEFTQNSSITASTTCASAGGGGGGGGIYVASTTGANAAITTATTTAATTTTATTTAHSKIPMETVC